MLSGESANGDYPVQSVAMMRSIIASTERHNSLLPSPLPYHDPSFTVFTSSQAEAVASSAVMLAHQIEAKAIVVMTRVSFSILFYALLTSSR
jgi:pyruvate kinase